MISLRTLFALVILPLSISTVQAKGHPKALTTAEVEARNEAAAPSFSGQAREAHRVTNFLGDALLLNHAQWREVDHYTVAEREALALAVTEADMLQAQRQYLLAVRRVLAASQMNSYVALRQQLAGTMLPLDGMELAVH